MSEEIEKTENIENVEKLTCIICMETIDNMNNMYCDERCAPYKHPIHRTCAEKLEILKCPLCNKMWNTLRW